MNCINKKVLALIAIFIFISTYLIGQESFPRWNFGVKGGMNISYKYDDSSSSTKTGYHTELFANYNFEERYFVRSGVKLSTKGASTFTITPNYPFFTQAELDRKIQYLQIPLMLGCRVKILDELDINFAAGLYLDYGIGTKNNYKAISYFQEESRDNIFQEEKMHFSKWDLARLKKLDPGAILNIEADYKNFILGVGYERGFNNIQKMPFIKGYDKWHNRNFTMSVGYRIH